MVSVLENLKKPLPSQVISTPAWQDFKDIDIVRYDLPSHPKAPSGKVTNAQFEDANNGNLYLPAAKMSAFRVRTQKRFASWVNAFAFRYHNQLGELDDHSCIWLDKNNKNKGPIIEIFIQIVKGTDTDLKQDQNNKLITFHLYPTTYVITAQGNLHSYWEQNEFTYLKSIVDADCNLDSFADTQGGNILTHDLSLNEINYMNFTSRIDSSTTNAKTISTPRLLTPSPRINKRVDEDMIHSIQNIEGKFCQLSTNLDKQSEKITQNEEKIQELRETTLSVECFENKIKDLQEKLERRINELKSHVELEKKQIYQCKTCEEEKQVRTQLSLENDVIKKENEQLKMKIKELEMEKTTMCNEKTALNTQYELLKNENVKLKEQTSQKSEETYVAPQVSTSNFYSLLETINHDEIGFEETEPKHANRELSKTQQASEINLIMDSHGNGIVGHKMYPRKKVKVTVLPSGEKNIGGVHKFCQNMKSPDHLIIGVGSNDLDRKDTKTCVSEMKSLLSHLVDNHKRTTIHVLPAFERVGNDYFNTKVDDYNREIKQYCARSKDINFIENNTISARKPILFSDGIHFSGQGKVEFVRLVKTHLNPYIGLKDYNTYSSSQRGNDENREVKNGYDNRNRNYRPWYNNNRRYNNQNRRAWNNKVTNKEDEINKIVSQLVQICS